MRGYVVEDFTPAEADILRRYFTNLDGPVFALASFQGELHAGGDFTEADGDTAIRFAREGYPLTSRVAWDWADNIATLSHDPTTREVFLTDDGRPPKEGTVHRQLKLAATLERIAKEGRDGFYAGQAVMEDLLAAIEETAAEAAEELPRRRRGRRRRG